MSALALLVCACEGGEGEGASEAAEEAESEESEVGEEGTDGFEPGGCMDACGTPNCGECPMPAQVEDQGIRIDAYEVDNGQYAAMLAVDFDLSVLPAGCEWKQGFVPMGWTEELDPALPVVGVDWCDAMVFCTWAGKQLCGSITSGGEASWDDALSPDDAWYMACSAGARRPTPTPSNSIQVRAMGTGRESTSSWRAGPSRPAKGGMTGLFDMSGNVWEWTYACAEAGGDGETMCRRRGGSYFSGEDSLRCAVDSERPRAERSDSVGFRCCG
ncbi:MAG: formylglycine-generating enzyme family protein [Deltaproteobacteria bacterium]|nr:formylglycine-generating enzyme family protein [Deltaproteobacteria bacterium]